MRSKFYKIAVLLAIISFIPLFIFVSRRENPPDKVNVPRHKTQTVENFRLKASGKEKWELVSPKAQFVDKNIVNLENPVLTVYLKNRVTVKAREARLDRSKGTVYLKDVKLVGTDFEAFSRKGIYYLRREVFKTNSGCKAIYNGVNSSKGRVCTIDLKSRKVIIRGRVKTVVREVLK